jgi:hypothetical protein
MVELDEITIERLFAKIDKMSDNIADLCNRMTIMEIDHRNHIEDIKAEQEKKLRTRDLLIVIVGLSLGFVEVIRALGVI